MTPTVGADAQRPKAQISRVRGTQDFLDMTIYRYLIDTVRRHVKRYHFSEIMTPILEHTELFRRSLGLSTDVVSKEMYSVVGGHAEEGGERLCLRPEMTASVMRAFLQGGIEQVPWKVFSVGPVFRHERPQKGRFRQFHQVTIEAVGASTVVQDIHMIAMLDRLFDEGLGLDAYALVINYLGCPADRIAHKKALAAFLKKHSTQICATCTERVDKNTLRVFDCKNEACQKLYQAAPVIVDHLCESCGGEWELLQRGLHELSVSYTYKPSLVRGLDYYQKTVFEFVSIGELGSQNAFCGGGRYDSLAVELGGARDYPSIGAALGIERLMMMLEARNRRALPTPAPLRVIIPVAAEQQLLALHLADQLIAAGECVEVLLEGQSMKSMMKQAHKLGAAHVIIMGETEQQQMVAQVKNMVTGTEVSVAQRDLVSYFKG